MTDEQKAEKRAKSKARREARKAAKKETPQVETESTANTGVVGTSSTVETPPPTPATNVTQRGLASPKKMVPVDSDKLDAVLDRIKKQDEEISVLREAVSRSKLMEVEDKRKQRPNPRVFLKVMENKDGKKEPVIGWKSSPENRILYNHENKPVGEVLRATYYFNDGTDTGEIDQLAFTRTTEVAYGDVVGTGTSRDGTETVRIKFHDTKKWGQDIVEVPLTFINP